MKKVLYFSRGYSVHDQRFLNGLAGADFQPFFLRLEGDQRKNAELELPQNVEILPSLNGDQKFTYGKAFQNVRELNQLIGELNPGLIHAGPIQSCAFLSALSGFKPLVSMSWGSDMLVESEKNWLIKQITSYSLKHSSVFLADCETVKRKAVQFGFPPERVVTFPWGVDLHKFYPGRNDALRNQLGWQEHFVLISNRSWEKIYGVEIIAGAFAEAVSLNPDLRLMLLGNGSLEKEINHILQKKGVEKFVLLVGKVDHDDLINYYQAADLYLSASYSDGSSVSLMEALACGLPALVSDISSNKEWIIPGKNGYLFRTGDADDLAHQIETVYQNRGLLGEIQVAARQTAENKANWQLNFQKLLDAYQMALN